MLDGVFAPGQKGALEFHPLPLLSTSELADLLQVVRVRVLSWLCRRGVIEDGSQLPVIDAALAEREPALFALASAAVSGLAPAGPERRNREQPPLVELTRAERSEPSSDGCRGDSFDGWSILCRSAAHGTGSWTSRAPGVGFRLARTLK